MIKTLMVPHRFTCVLTCLNSISGSFYKNFYKNFKKENQEKCTIIIQKALEIVVTDLGLSVSNEDFVRTAKEKNTKLFA